MPEAAPTDLVTKVEDTIRRHVISKMPPDSTGELSSMALRQLLGVYWTWRERFPEPRPRTVHDSRELDASSKAQGHSADLTELQRTPQVHENRIGLLHATDPFLGIPWLDVY